MRRDVERYLEDPLAEEFLRGNIKQDKAEIRLCGQRAFCYELMIHSR
jgi:hypothetical protein